MKKLIAMLLAMVMVLGLVACAAKTEPPAADTKTETPAAETPAAETPAEETPAEETPAAEGRIPIMRNRKNPKILPKQDRTRAARRL